MDTSQVDWLKAVTATVGLAAAAAWGQLDAVLQVLLILMGLDLASGLIAGGRTTGLSSEVGVKGLRRKAATLIVVGATSWAQPYLGAIPAAAAVTGAFAAMEFLSVLENAGRAGVQYPAFLRDALTKLRDQVGAPAGAEPH